MKKKTGAVEVEEVTGLQRIPLKAIMPTEFNPRRVKGNEPSIMELAESIKAHGQLQPGVCRPHPEEHGFYELLAGCCRWHACRHAGKDTMLVMVSDVDDQAAREITVLENLQRKELTPFEEAKGFQMLIDTGSDLEQVAARIGKSVRFVKRRAQITKLSEAMRDLVEQVEAEGYVVPVDHLERIARYDESVQNAVARDLDWRWTQHGPGTVDALSDTLSRFVADLKLAPWKLDEVVLVPAAGSCAACPKRSDRQAELFDDLPDQPGSGCALCLDLGCWGKKMAAHKEKAEHDLRRKFPNLVKVTESYRAQGDVLGYEHYQVCKKSDAGSVPALMMDGQKEGRQIYVQMRASASGKVKSAGASAGEKTPARPLSERREGLELRRKALAVEVLTEAMAMGKYRTFTRVDEVLCVLCTFGTDNREDHADDETWGKFDQAMDSNDDYLMKAIELVIPVLVNRLKIYQTSDVVRVWPEAVRVAALLELDLAAFKKMADSDIPEPKAWAKESPAPAVKTAKDRKKAAAGDDSAVGDEDEI